jgi:hypothetical protein
MIKTYMQMYPNEFSRISHGLQFIHRVRSVLIARILGENKTNTRINLIFFSAFRNQRISSRCNNAFTSSYFSNGHVVDGVRRSEHIALHFTKNYPGRLSSYFPGPNSTSIKEYFYFILANMVYIFSCSCPENCALVHCTRVPFFQTTRTNVCLVKIQRQSTLKNYE